MGLIMIHQTKLVFCLTALCLCFPIAAFGCAISTAKPITKFDDSQYVFIGEVTGLVGPLEAEYVKGQAWGVLVKMDGKVFIPKEPLNNFEVFPFALGGDCGSVGISQQSLIKALPIGSKVRVIAREAVVFKDGVGPGNIRLEIHPLAGWGSGGTGSITRNDGDSAASVSEEYNYKSFTIKNLLEMTPSEKLALSRLGFELRKDLLRLAQAGTDKERVDVLRRLVYYPDPFEPIDISAIARLYVKDEKLVEGLREESEGHLRKMIEGWTQPPNNGMHPTRN